MIKLIKGEKEIIADIVKETIKELQQGGNIKYGSSYFQKTEKLLHNYKALKAAIHQKETELTELKCLEENEKEDSKSIIVFNGEEYVEREEGYKRSKKLTEWLVKKIDRALDTIKNDKYFFIVEEKYFKKASNEDLSERLESLQESTKIGSSERTIQRNKKRMIQKVAVTLFGAGALEDICRDII